MRAEGYGTNYVTEGSARRSSLRSGNRREAMAACQNLRPTGAFTTPFARRTAMSPFDAVSRRCVRAAAVSPPFPLGGALPSPVSAEGKPSLVRQLLGCRVGGGAQ